MVQTLQIMLGAIEARKAVVEEREAARLAEAAAPAVQSTLSAYLQAPTPSAQVTSISEDEPIQVEEARPKRRRGERGPTKKMLAEGTERRLSSRLEHEDRDIGQAR